MNETGDPDVLRVQEAEPPALGDGQVLIKVHAASVNAIDWRFRRGLVDRQLPAVLGSDVSGTVETSRAEGFAEGEEVFGLAASGGYAELATASAAAIARKPAGVDHEQAAALVAGAAGGVGHFAVQLANNAGARAIGTGSSRNRDYVLGLGAEQYVDYTQQEVAEAVSGVDVAFDTVGGQTTESLLPAVREGGVLVTIAGAPPEQAAQARGVRAELLVMSPRSEQLARLAELVESGEVRVEIAEVLPLGEVVRAHALSESGHVRGKIILAVGS